MITPRAQCRKLCSRIAPSTPVLTRQRGTVYNRAMLKRRHFLALIVLGLPLLALQRRESTSNPLVRYVPLALPLMIKRIPDPELTRRTYQMLNAAYDLRPGVPRRVDG